MDSVLSSGHTPRRTAQISFSSTIEPTRLSPAYRFGLAIVAVAMLLLPLLYLGLIALTGAGVWWHLSANAWILTGGGGIQWRILLYAAPPVVGVLLLFFLVKPILARPGQRPEPILILRDAEPGFFAFIEQICRQVQAPLPQRVEVNCEINASASFMPRRFGVSNRNLALTIGLPLVAGLSVRELGGVLAHEFGHFAQGGGMRLTMLVRRVNIWFARVVYERDRWDQAFEDWSRDSDLRVSIVLVMARGAIWVSRRVLAGLMVAGHAISCFMLRQMEYDADSYEVKLAGSDAFARTMTRLRELNVATQLGYRDLETAWQNRTLPSSLPAFVIEGAGRIPEELLSEARRTPETATGLLHTHPSDADRVRAAMAAATPGVLVGGEEPATRLFQDFEGLSAAATRHHYEHDLGLSLATLTLVPADKVAEEITSHESRLKSADQFFRNCVSFFRPLRVEIDDVEGLDAVELRSALDDARSTMATSRDDLSQAYQRFGWLQTRREKSFAAHTLLAAGFTRLNAEEFELAQVTADEATATDAWASEQQQELAPSLERFDRAAARRLSCAVCLLRLTPQVEGHEAMLLIDALKAVTGVMPHLYNLRRLLLAEAMLKRYGATTGDPVLLQRHLAPLGVLITSDCERLRAGLGNVPCPSPFAAALMTVAAWCGLPPDARTASPEDIVGKLATLHFGLLARLASLALQVEADVRPDLASRHE